LGRDEWIAVVCNHPPARADLGRDNIGKVAAGAQRLVASLRWDSRAGTVRILVGTFLRGVLRPTGLVSLQRNRASRHADVFALNGDLERDRADEIEIAVVGLRVDVVHALDVGKDGKEGGSAVCGDEVEGRRGHAEGGAGKG
jgi:hypothetical protein